MATTRGKSSKPSKPPSAGDEVPIVAGPRKKRRAEPPEPRLSLHKTRAVWFQARASYPLREAPVDRLVQERARTKAPDDAPVPAWQPAGPTNVGGRATSIVAHPTKPDSIWLGTAGGGVWFSSDAGKTWVSQWQEQDILNIGSLAVDPVDPQVLYCGTGEANLSVDSYPGVGIYSTKDGGKTWKLLADTSTIPSRIGALAVDPFDRDHLILGGIGYGEMSTDNDLGGLYVSRSRGVAWTRVDMTATNLNYWCHSVVFDPATRNVVYAAITERGTRNGIYKSIDGGTTWKQLKKGLPPPDLFGRTSLAVSRSNPNIIYALACGRASSAADRVLGVFRSADGGATWRDTAGSYFLNEGQMSYGNTIAVHPTNPDHVLCGGVDLHRTMDGGGRWEQVTRWYADRKFSDYAHADHHALLITTKGRVYDPNDGGLDVSENGGTDWTNRSNGLAVSMFYDLDVAQSDAGPKFYGGGLQDNGTVVTTKAAADQFVQVLDGDGGWMIIDPRDATHYFGSIYNFSIWRFRAGQPGPEDVSPPADWAEQSSVWMCFIDIDPNDSKTLVTGSYRVWRTTDDAMSWSAVSDSLDGSAISAVEIAPADSRRIYVGTTDGGIFRSTNSGASWSADISSAVVPGYTITRLATSPKDASLVYATSANFGRSHVFRSRDGGDRWEAIDGNALPDAPHHVIVVVPKGRKEILYVGNDAGVFMSDDDGLHWRNVSGNLPHVMVVDLVYHAATSSLFAATYGRSTWRLAL